MQNKIHAIYTHIHTHTYIHTHTQKYIHAYLRHHKFSHPKNESVKKKKDDRGLIDDVPCVRLVTRNE